MKFVSLSQLLGCPLFGSNSGLFTVPGFIVSLVGVKKKKPKTPPPKKNRRKKRYKGKEGVEQEGRKEGMKVLKERKNNNKELIIKRQKKTSLLASNWPRVFGCSQLRGPSLALLHSDQLLGSLWPSCAAAPETTGSGTHPPPGYGCARVWTSMVPTLPSSCGLRSRQGAHTPQCLGCSLRPPQGVHSPQ